MRRSGQLKKQATAPAAPPAEHPAEDTQAGKGEEAGEKAAGGDKAEAKPGGKAGEQANDAAFYEDMKKYPGQLERLVREVAAKTQAAQRQADARYEPLMKALAEKYGTTPDDLDGIMEALKGPVKDDAYYNALAMQMARASRTPGRWTSLADPEPADAAGTAAPGAAGSTAAAGGPGAADPGELAAAGYGDAEEVSGV